MYRPYSMHRSPIYRAAAAVLLVVGVVFGQPTAAGLLARWMAPSHLSSTGRDGSTTEVKIGNDAPRPAWVPVPPDVSIVQASAVTNSLHRHDGGALNVTSRAPLDQIRHFYDDKLRAAGFAVKDINARTGDGAIIDGTRAANGDEIHIFVGEPSGLIASRLIQIEWTMNRPGGAQPARR